MVSIVVGVVDIFSGVGRRRRKLILDEIESLFFEEDGQEMWEV